MAPNQHTRKAYYRHSLVTVCKFSRGYSSSARREQNNPNEKYYSPSSFGLSGDKTFPARGGRKTGGETEKLYIFPMERGWKAGHYTSGVASFRDLWSWVALPMLIATFIHVKMASNLLFLTQLICYFDLRMFWFMLDSYCFPRSV